jgi:UDP-glucose 4-epimerase
MIDSSACNAGHLGKVLVTGGLGFIGYHLCDALTKYADLVIVDDESSSVVPASWFAGRARVEVRSIVEFVPQEEFDWVCHLASPVGPTKVMSAEGDVAKAIVGSMCWLIANIVPKKTRIVYISTSEVYGIPRAASETDDLVVRFPYSGRREYSCSKLLGEIMLSNALRQACAPPPLIIRPFNVAGPRQSDRGGFVLPRFAASIIAQRPMTVYGDGLQRRCFTHAADVAEAIIGLMQKHASGLFNVGNVRNNVSILELAQRVALAAEKMGFAEGSAIHFVNPMVLHGSNYEEAPDKIPNVTKIETLTGWRPEHDLDSIVEGVLKTSVAAELAAASP